MSTQTTVLDVRAATKSYSGRVRLDELSLSITSGQVYALIGPNGAGKTTLVRAICRRLSLDSGEVRVLDKDPRRSRQARAAIGLVPQEIALYTELSVRQNLEIFGCLSGTPGPALGRAVDEALGWTGLDSRASTAVGELSGGMQRRLNLAVATLHEPRLLLLDEPTVGIDPNAREAIHERLRTLRRSGVAILLTTHDLEQAEELADQVGVIVDGQKVAEGQIDELVSSIFGDSKEIHVLLREVPDAKQQQFLSAKSLHPDAELSSWSGPLKGGLEDLGVLAGHLGEIGLQVDEFRVREPGLRGAFLKLTGRELSS